MSEPRRARSSGSAYGRPKQKSNALLTEVGPGTPCGELMRRYWQPIAISAELASDRPRKVRVLGEDLVLFRDRNGRAGLLYPRCMHRGTTLYYGKVEERGLRCCYHGWLFDVEGNCLEQPCEPEGGLHRDAARQPWYPVEELYGLVFAYLGPLEKKPVLPRYDIFENLEPGERLDTCIGGWAATLDYSIDVLPYSWLHMCDNIMDPFHVYVLHSTFTGIQFSREFATPPKVDFFTVDEGVCYSAIRKMDNGQEYERISSYIFPNIMSVPDTLGLRTAKATAMAWVVPVDDTHFVQVQLGKSRDGHRFAPRPANPQVSDKLWSEMSQIERRDYPTDFEAQEGQGPISLHSEEHLATSDRGIVMQRRMLTQQIKVVEDGGDPLGVTFDASKAVVNVRSGNFFRAAEAAE
jgi:phenylpropionate dioxygenase-like ring-hydroxylating dioxygenase large terminal subunit